MVVISALPERFMLLLVWVSSAHEQSRPPGQKTVLNASESENKGEAYENAKKH
jgi:hypothetical protein